jgi:serine/threonine-protein kinase
MSVWLVLLRFTQPQIAPIVDDPVNRLVVLAAVLSGIALFVLRRQRIVAPHTLMRLGMGFEILVALSIATIETSGEFTTVAPLLGLSAIAGWILLAAAVIPATPLVRLGLAAGAATAWPVALAVNATRLGLVIPSWTQAAIWPAANYVCAMVAYLVARWLYATAPEQRTEALGNYELMSRIGEGGMGEVWRARHKTLARPAAVKLVRSDIALHGLLARRFQREVDAIAALQSPHTVYLYDAGTTSQGGLYYVMELLDGISLQTLVGTFGPQPPSRVVAILQQICQSLEEAHERKIVHRDIKPSNVMICHVAQIYDFVKVLDFGLAKPFDNPNASNLTALGATTGTPEYMAPEVAAGSARIGPPADLYAVGCVGYFLLTGRLVFDEANPMKVVLQHMKTTPIPPSRRTEQAIPPDLERVVLKCLAKQPGDRPADARSLNRMLAACDVPRWTDEDAAEWWSNHVPASSPLRAFARPADARSVV